MTTAVEVKQKKVDAAERDVQRLTRLKGKDDELLSKLEENYQAEKKRLTERLERHQTELDTATAQLNWVRSMPVPGETAAAEPVPAGVGG